jgi:hypothetical protein
VTSVEAPSPLTRYIPPRTSIFEIKSTGYSWLSLIFNPSTTLNILSEQIFTATNTRHLPFIPATEGALLSASLQGSFNPSKC